MAGLGATAVLASGNAFTCIAFALARATAPLAHHPMRTRRRPVARTAVPRYAGRVRTFLFLMGAALSLAVAGCDGGGAPAAPSGPTQANPATVRIVFMGATARRTDFPVSAQECLSGVGVTHTHPSWRNFEGIPLQPVPPDRYEITFIDVPVNTRVSLRINDQNACDENPTGAVTRNVFANSVRLAQNTTTPGNGDEPGFAFTIAPNGAITQ